MSFPRLPAVGNLLLAARTNIAGSTESVTLGVHRGGSAGEDQRLRVLGEHLRHRHVVGDDLGVDPGLADAAGDNLGVLRPEVDDEDAIEIVLDSAAIAPSLVGRSSSLLARATPNTSHRLPLDETSIATSLRIAYRSGPEIGIQIGITVRHVGRIALMLLGAGLLGGTVFVVIQGTHHPSSTYSILIALTTALAGPLGISCWGLAWSLGRTPHARELRTEAQAKARAAAALEDAESAEKVRQELQAYVAIRARKLEIDRRRAEAVQAARSVVDKYNELNEAERTLGLDATTVSEDTKNILDKLVGPPKRVNPFEHIFLPFGLGELFAKVYELGTEQWERRRLRKLAEKAPTALKDRESQEPPT